MPGLRFDVGAAVMCNLGPRGWALGRIIALHYREDSWPAGTAAAPYQVALEDHTLIFVPEDDARFCREVNHPHLKMMYDTFHANIEEKDPIKAIDACKDQLVHVHISENDRSTPGEGQIHWDESFEGLKKANYDGWLTIEAFGLALPELAAATRIWRRMFPTEEYLAKNGLKFMKERWEGK